MEIKDKESREQLVSEAESLGEWIESVFRKWLWIPCDMTRRGTESRKNDSRIETKMPCMMKAKRKQTKWIELNWTELNWIEYCFPL